MKQMLWIIVFLFLNIFNLYAQEEYIYDSQGKRDPMLPLISKEGVILLTKDKVGLSDLYLEGIMYDPGGNSFILVNGKVFKKGDVIDAFKIEEIKEEEVSLSKEDKTYQLKLIKENK